MRKVSLHPDFAAPKNAIISSRKRVQLMIAIVVGLLFIPFTGHTQINGQLPYSNRLFFISDLPSPVCDPSYGTFMMCSESHDGLSCGTSDLSVLIPQSFENALANAPERILKATAGVPYNVRFGLRYDSPYAINIPVGGTTPVFVSSDGGATMEPGQAYAVLTEVNGSDYDFSVTVRFPKGTSQGALVIQLREDYSSGGPAFVINSIIIPVYVVGPMHPEEETPILGTTLDPQIPYMILHDPPGDGSSASFQDNKTTCRSRETQYARDESNMFHGSAKLGVKGSVGLIANLDYEIYVEFKGSANIGDVGILATTDQVCISTGVGFSTSDLPGAEGEGDVFIGFGRELYFGMYDVIDLRDCGLPFMDRALVYAPVPGSDRKFVYTESAIRSEIATLSALAGDTLQSDRVRNQSQNQIDVWEQVLALNEANKNNPNNDTLDLLTYSAGNTQTHSSSIDIVNTSSITTEHYIEGTFGLDLVVNIGGSGFGLGYEYATSERFGATENESAESAQILDYTLTDDDDGDIFSVDIVRDPMFGTPVFRLNQGSRTSCPFEGGYMRDQPKLTIANTQDTEIVSAGNENGAVASFKLDLCNNSNEERQYFLKLNAQSNLNGAEVRAAGVPLNGNDFGQEFNIPAFSCIEDLIINVSQQAGSTEEAFPNLEIFLYSFCDPEASASIIASVFYDDATGVKDIYGDPSFITVFPNPTQDEVNVQMADGYMIDGYELRDLTGKLIKHKQFDSPVQKDAIQLGSISAGMYLLQVKSAHQRFTTKIFRQ